MATLLLTGLSLTLVLGTLLRLLNIGHTRRNLDHVPEGFEKSIDHATLRRMSAYAQDRARLALVNDAFFRLVVVGAVALGILCVYDDWIQGLTSSLVWQGTLYLLLLSWAGALVALPFELYENFVVEARHGFNHSSTGLFWLDFLKSRAIMTVLLAAVAVVGLTIVELSGRYWWLLIWAFLCALQILITLVAPKIIEPLFVKMSPLQSEELRERILSMTRSVGVRVDRVMQVDASRRSGHTNAYFSGIGPVKRVVLFDTLLTRLSPDEIVAVLAHELGHWKHRHVLQRIVVGQLIVLVACAGAGFLVSWNSLPSLIGAQQASFPLRVTIVLLIGSVLEFFLEPVLNLWSRKHEWQADAFAIQQVPARHLQAALIKLAKDNLANLHMHPWYVAYHASHPTLPARVARLNASDDSSVN